MSKRRDSVFISYCHKDRIWLERLHIQLQPLIRVGGIDAWDDRRIQPGQRWREEIRQALGRAKLAVLLVTPEFLASEFITTNELPQILASNRTRGLGVLWVAVKHSLFQETAVAEYQAVNDPAKPLTRLHYARVDEELVKICLRIKEALQTTAEPERRVAGSDAPRSDPRKELTLSQTTNAITDHTDAGATVPTGMSERYDIIGLVSRGHYGEVRKCRDRETGDIVIVKNTIESMVSVPALTALRELGMPNVVAARRIWQADGFVFEELPYVGGIKLSESVVRGIGGLTGAVLEDFHDQMAGLLESIHRIGIVHRDVHPDNIYIVMRPRQSPGRSMLGGFGENTARPFELSYYLVDSTFAIPLADAARFPPISHGSFSAPEQVQGKPEPASDWYSLAATLIYGIMGTEPPTIPQRLTNARSLLVPRGGHPKVGFDTYLRGLLELDPRARRLRRSYRDASISADYTGTMLLADTLFLAADVFDSCCELLNIEDAAAFHDGLKIFYHPSHGWEARHHKDAIQYWKNRFREGNPDAQRDDF